MYQVQLDNEDWNVCGHRHRTASGAVRCRRRKSARGWNGARITGVGHALALVERQDVEDAEAHADYKRWG